MTPGTVGVAWIGDMGHLAGKRLLITSGPTRARIDAVRFISNTSTGRLGAAVAEASLREGADVVYVHGPDAALPSLQDAERLRTVGITWVGDLFESARAVLQTGPFDAVIHAMAVLDYRPSAPVDAKTPSGAARWEIILEPVPKLLPLLRRWHPLSILVGFKLGWALSHEALLKAARELLETNGLDLVVANDLHLLRETVHPAAVLDARGVMARATTKQELAAVLLEEVSRRLTR